MKTTLESLEKVASSLFQVRRGYEGLKKKSYSEHVVFHKPISSYIRILIYIFLRKKNQPWQEGTEKFPLIFKVWCTGTLRPVSGGPRYYSVPNPPNMFTVHWLLIPQTCPTSPFCVGL